MLAELEEGLTADMVVMMEEKQDQVDIINIALDIVAIERIRNLDWLNESGQDNEA